MIHNDHKFADNTHTERLMEWMYSVDRHVCILIIRFRVQGARSCGIFNTHTHMHGPWGFGVQNKSKLSEAANSKLNESAPESESMI